MHHKCHQLKNCWKNQIDMFAHGAFGRQDIRTLAGQAKLQHVQRLLPTRSSVHGYIQTSNWTLDIWFWPLQLLYNLCIYLLICCIMLVSIHQHLKKNKTPWGHIIYYCSAGSALTSNINMKRLWLLLVFVVWLNTLQKWKKIIYSNV